MQSLPIRLRPGDDLRRGIEAAVAAQGCDAAFVVSGIGSLRPAMVRFAGLEAATCIEGDTELLSLSGSVSPDGAHLHLVVSDAEGRVFGGHAAYGSVVRTTAEILIALLPDWRFRRKPDATTGWAELDIAAVAPRVGEP